MITSVFLENLVAGAISQRSVVPRCCATGPGPSYSGPKWGIMKTYRVACVVCREEFLFGGTFRQACDRRHVCELCRCAILARIDETLTLQRAVKADTETVPDTLREMVEK